MLMTESSSSGFRLGRFFGIEVFIDPWIAVPFLFIASSGSGNVMLGVMLMVIVFTCVLLHEYGHALAARSVGVGTHRITLGMLGGVAVLNNARRTALQDLWITVAGPLVNVVLWLVATVILNHTSEAVLLQSEWPGWVAWLARINFMLLMFNLIPAFPMDGGRMLHGGLLLAGLSRWKALYIAATVACISAAGIVAWGLWDWQMEGDSLPIFRFLIAFQVWTSAVNIIKFLRQIEHTNPELAPGPGEI
jgi:Zn-dependent protease